MNRDISEQQRDADGNTLPQSLLDTSTTTLHDTTSSTITAEDDLTCPQSDVPFNLAELGLVHLASTRSDSGSASGSSRRARSAVPKTGSNRSSVPSAPVSSFNSGPQTPAKSNSGKSGDNSPAPPPLVAGGEVKESVRPSPQPSKASDPSTITSTDPQSKLSTSQTDPGEEADVSDAGPDSRHSLTVSDVTEGTDGGYPFTTVRFQHAQDENGNHVIIGREGKLDRCEDEV